MPFMKPRRICLLSLVVGFTSATAMCAQQPWDVLWTAAAPYPTPAVAPDGTIYASTLYAFSPSGSNKWLFAALPQEVSPTIALDGAVLIGGLQHKLSVVNPDVTVRWSFQAGADVRASVALG